jgi:hypothetical protein
VAGWIENIHFLCSTIWLKSIKNVKTGENLKACVSS